MASGVMPIVENKKSWCQPSVGCGSDMSLIQPAISYLKSDQTSSDAMLLDIDVKSSDVTLFEKGEKKDGVVA